MAGTTSNHLPKKKDKMTGHVTISNPPQRAFCKAVCWLFGIVAGSYLAIALVNDFGERQLRAAVLGIVAALLTGLLMRRLLCRQHGSRVERRIQEAAARAAAKEAMAKKNDNGRVPDHSRLLVLDEAAKVGSALRRAPEKEAF